VSLAVVWDHAARGYWDHLSPGDALRVDRAVLRFAETGEGDVRWEPPYHRLRVAGRVGFYQADLVVDREAGTMIVLQIYRAS
jgi:hypothetical protein